MRVRQKFHIRVDLKRQHSIQNDTAHDFRVIAHHCQRQPGPIGCAHQVDLLITQGRRHVAYIGGVFRRRIGGQVDSFRHRTITTGQQHFVADLYQFRIGDVLIENVIAPRDIFRAVQRVRQAHPALVKEDHIAVHQEGIKAGGQKFHRIQGAPAGAAIQVNERVVLYMRAMPPHDGDGQTQGIGIIGQRRVARFRHGDIAAFNREASGRVKGAGGRFKGGGVWLCQRDPRQQNDAQNRKYPQEPGHKRYLDD